LLLILSLHFAKPEVFLLLFIKEIS
jgi:hypothetical protein